MRSVGGDVDGLPTRGLAKVCNESVQDDRKVVQKGVKADARGNSEEVESRKNGEENGGRVELRHAQTAPQKQHELQHLPQSQSSVVRWDRFLPLRSLKVLLVENDDSTRHVVGALLRNCSYEVTSVSNGLEAWKMLADLTNHIDLVLTEVAMPGLSGIALLSKIMNHKTCKNIPVIMTSSNDSMGIVFKCLSKGAVDFLVKPIRKNELKNLWQHVWRKCHSSSGSGSESGTRTQKSIKSKIVQGSDNHTDSNDDDEERSIGLNYRNGSDNGSGTQQSSWSKRAVEVDSPRPMSPWEGSADPPDSTCALVIHSKPGVDSISWVPTNASKKSQKQNDLSDNMAMGKDLTIGVPRDTDLQMKGPINGVLAKATHTHNEKGTCTNADLEKVRDKLRSLKYHNDTKKDKLLGKDSDLMGANTNIPMAHGGSAGNEVPYDSSKITTTLKDMVPSNTKELPSIMPSLKRPRESNAVTTTQERNVLRHSDNSAFSRYNTVSTANQTATAVVGSCSPANNSSEAGNKAESLLNLQSNSSGTPNQGSNGSSNNNDMGSTTNKDFTKSEVLIEKLAPKSTTLTIQASSAFQPVQHGHNSSLQPVTSGKPDTAKNTPGQQTQVEHHHHHHYHHHHHHVHNLQQQQQLLNTDDMSFGNMITGSPQFEQSNMSNGGIEDDAANYGSASGSNNGSNGQNGSSTAVVVEEMNMASDVGVGGTGKCGTVEAIVATGNRISMDQDRLAQREAALNKFRLKRKERCFDKKVRYQSRKKLAEQRPRIRGQFVRQTVDENKIKDKSNNPDS